MPDNTSFPVQKRALGYCLPCVISIKIELLQVDASFLDQLQGELRQNQFNPGKLAIMI